MNKESSSGTKTGPIPDSGRQSNILHQGMLLNQGEYSNQDAVMNHNNSVSER
jgi:hypothetical protein